MNIPDGFWQHQKDSVHKALMKNYHGLFHEQGTGKTATAITILKNIFQKHNRALKTIILCPQIVIDNWDDEIKNWSECGNYVCKLQGSGKKRIKLLNESDKKIFITNFEALYMEGLFWETRRKKKVVIDHGFEVMIVDESHRLKTHNAVSTKVAIEMSDKIFYRYILTGTLMLDGKGMDIWSQMRILDGGRRLGKNFYKFREEFFEDRNANMPTQKHFPNWQFKKGREAELTRHIFSAGDRVTKDEALDLPPLLEQSIENQMSPSQKEAYGQMYSQYIAILDGETGQRAIAELAMTKALRLLQISSGFVTTDEGEIFEFQDNPRLKVLKEILEDCSEKVIIWAVFKPNYKRIAEVCDKLKIKYRFLTGEQTKKQKDEALHDFTKGDAQVLIANPSAGGTGVNLVEAPIAIWYSRSWKLEDRLQALARNHRGGSEMHEKITSIDLVTPGTVENQVLTALRNKEDFAEVILRR